MSTQQLITLFCQLLSWREGMMRSSGWGEGYIFQLPASWECKELHANAAVKWVLHRV